MNISELFFKCGFGILVLALLYIAGSTAMDYTDEVRAANDKACAGRGMVFNNRHHVCVGDDGVMYSVVVKSAE